MPGMKGSTPPEAERFLARSWSASWAAATSAACFFLLAPFSAHAQVVISEILYDPAGADQGNEWVELYNAGAAPVDLTKWTFSDGATSKTTGNLVHHAFSASPASGAIGGMMLAPQSYAVLADNAAAVAAAFPGLAQLIDTTMTLPNPSGGASATLVLFDDAGGAENTVAYEGGAADGNGASLQLQSDGSWLAAP